jgi:hypothetical protein
LATCQTERKVEFFFNPVIFLRPAGNYFLLVAFFTQKKNSQKSLAEFFLSLSDENMPQKKTADCGL